MRAVLIAFVRKACILGCAAITAATALTGSAAAGPLQVHTADGPVTLPQVPQTIVALDAAAIDTLSALGVVPQGIASPLFVEAVEGQIAGATVVGTLFEPDFEKIAALSPDVIVIGARAASQADPLRKIAPVLNMAVGQDVLADGMARLAAFGTLTGRSDKADDLAQALDAKVARARALVAGRGTALIVMTNGPKVSVFGPQSRFGWLHTSLGWETAKSDIAVSPHGEAVSFEYIAEANPDTLLIIDRGRAVAQGLGNAEATLDNRLVAGTKAAQAGQIIYLSPAEIYVTGGGVQALNVTLDEIIAALEG